MAAQFSIERRAIQPDVQKVGLTPGSSYSFCLLTGLGRPWTFVERAKPWILEACWDKRQGSKPRDKPWVRMSRGEGTLEVEASRVA